MASATVEILTAAETDAASGGGCHQPSADLRTQRGGYHDHRWNTRLGTIGLLVRRLHNGSHFPGWLLKPRRRLERALVQVVTECCVHGGSTHHVDNLVRNLSAEGTSKSQVSELARESDTVVKGSRGRTLEHGLHPFTWLNAVLPRCREGERALNMVMVIATEVNRDGHRCIRR